MPAEQQNDGLAGHFEQRLGAALRHAGGAFDSDRAALVAAGETRGRAIRRRRRVAALSGAAAVALVGVGGALVVPWDGGDSARQQRSVGGEKTSSAPSVSPTGTADPSPVSGDELLRTLKSLLPDGEFSDESARGTDSRVGPYAHLVYDDGKGAGAIEVGFNRVEPGSEQARQVTRCPDKALTPYDSCNTSKLPGGSALMIFQGYEYPDRRVDTKWWHAELVTPEGGQVSVLEWNAAAEKDAPISRPEPPLSPAQLKAVATASEWAAVLDTIPESETLPGSTSPPAEDNGALAQQTFIGLLPKGVKAVSQGGQGSGYAYLVVDDGKGRSFVQINVQRDMSDVEDELFGPDAEVRPDGTKVATHQGPGDDDIAGVVMWTVDTIRTDGRRVVVSAFNAPGQNTGPSRDTPALTMQELRAIALSPAWLDLPDDSSGGVLGG